MTSLKTSVVSRDCPASSFFACGGSPHSDAHVCSWRRGGGRGYENETRSHQMTSMRRKKHSANSVASWSAHHLGPTYCRRGTGHDKSHTASVTLHPHTHTAHTTLHPHTAHTLHPHPLTLHPHTHTAPSLPTHCTHTHSHCTIKHTLHHHIHTLHKWHVQFSQQLLLTIELFSTQRRRGPFSQWPGPAYCSTHDQVSSKLIKCSCTTGANEKKRRGRRKGGKEREERVGREK